MASELRVNTLKDASGNNSIATSFVAGGSAKCYALSAVGAAATTSLNLTSITDNGTGDFTFTIASDFDAANKYAHPIVPADNDGGGGMDITVTSKAAGSIRIGTIRDDSTKTDNAHFLSVSMFGDLA